MDDFVKSIKEEVKTENDTTEDIPLNNYRELFSRFIISNPQIKKLVLRKKITK